MDKTQLASIYQDHPHGFVDSDSKFLPGEKSKAHDFLVSGTSSPKGDYKLFRSASMEVERKLYDPITEYVFKKYLDDNCEFCKHSKL